MEQESMVMGTYMAVVLFKTMSDASLKPRGDSSAFNTSYS